MNFHNKQACRRIRKDSGSATQACTRPPGDSSLITLSSEENMSKVSTKIGFHANK